MTWSQRDDIRHLFVYGSLFDEHQFRLITGKVLPSQPAILMGYRRIKPEKGFAFAVPWRGDHIHGRLYSDITSDIIARLDEYEAEGKLYRREVVEVRVGDEIVPAFVYLAIPEAIQPYLQRGYSERDRIEEFVENSVNRYLDEKADRCFIADRKSLALRVTKELLSEEIHGLLEQYFYHDGLPAFIFKHEIEKADLPSLEWLRQEPKAQRYADYYLQLVIKWMIFNQIESKFRDHFRSLVKESNHYHQHTISSLMALRLLVMQQTKLNHAMEQLAVNRYNPDFEYTDYAIAALFIADELFQMGQIQAIAEWVAENRHPSTTPLGAEMEFSQLGVRAIHAAEGEDPFYDGFYYFYDFDLNRRGWKLGAHIDDHGFQSPGQTRTRGFLELAIGRNRLLGDASKPATSDPWILSQLIQHAVRFLGLRPHSLHISIQADETIPFKKLENPDFFLCLLLLGGDLREDEDGKLREMRIFHAEILHPDTGVYISRLNRHQQNPDDRKYTWVVEYQFPRLYYDYDYQPLIMALKGFQKQANPYPFKDCKDCPYQEENLDIELSLKQWAAFPTAVSETSCQQFLEIVAAGLYEEARQLGDHHEQYVDQIMVAIEEQIHQRNQRIKDYHQSKLGRMATP